MTDINELVVQNFQDNVAYLEKNHPNVFDKIAALDSAIENGHYEEKYELIYENSYFDVLEKSTQKLLYGQDSNEFADLVKQQIDYNPQTNTFQCFENTSVSTEEKKQLLQEEKFTNYLGSLANLLNYTQKNLSGNSNLKSLDKFIFFGIGLGVHLSMVDKKISSSSYLIIEDDLELFRLSLFVTNYKTLALDALLYFSIFDNQQEFSQISKTFLENNYFDNSYIEYFIMLNNSTEKRDLFHQEAISQPHLTYHFNTILTQSLKPLSYINENYKFLNKGLSFFTKSEDNTPFLLLAAGPSLQKNREWLRNNHKKFIIIAISAVLPFLEKENIVPDLIFHLEGASHASKLFENINSIDFFSQSVCLFSSRTPTDVINLFNKNKIFLFENSTNYKHDSLKLLATCVGSMAHQLLLLFKIKNFYLLGLDLAVGKDGKTHIDGHTRTKTLSLKENSTISYQRNLVPVDGNNTKSVFTTLQYKSSIDTINYSSQLFQNNKQTIYNLSDGASFKGTIPTNIEKIKLPNLEKDFKEYIYNLFDTNCTVGLKDTDSKALQDKLLQANKTKEFISSLANNRDIQISSFLNNLKELAFSFASSKENLKYELDNILDNYLRHSLPVVFNFFNSENILDINIHFDYIKKSLYTELLEIVDYYIKSIERF